MTTLASRADSSAAFSNFPDFVSTDTVALASHMSDCASTRSRIFGLQTMLESVHSAVQPRMATVAVIAALLLGVASTL